MVGIHGILIPQFTSTQTLRRTQQLAEQSLAVCRMTGVAGGETVFSYEQQMRDISHGLIRDEAWVS